MTRRTSVKRCSLSPKNALIDPQRLKLIAHSPLYQIPIEQRSSDEVTRGTLGPIAPEGVEAYNPAFDVTPAALITGWITERGLVKPPFV